jgi:polysaccharide biosynthesis protein VpsM
MSRIQQVKCGRYGARGNARSRALGVAATGGAIALLGSLGASPLASAQTIGVGVGSVTFFPSATVAVTYDDNVRGEADAESDVVTSLSAGIGARFDSGTALGRFVEIDYTLDGNLLSTDEDDDTLSQTLRLRSNVSSEGRHRFGFSAGLRREEAITERDQPNDRFNISEFGSTYGLGVSGAPFNAEFGYGFERKRSVDSDFNLDKELDQHNVAAALLYRIGPRTQAIGKLEYRASDYDSATRLDNARYGYSAGLRWDATARISGEVLGGLQQQRFDAPDVDDRDSVAWQGAVNWAVREYSVLSFSTARSLEDGDEGSTSTRNTRVGVDWRYRFTWPGTLSLGVSENRISYVGIGRSDTTQSARVGFEYAVGRLATLGLNYTYTDQDSTLAGEIFDRNQVRLFLTVAP